MLVKDILEQNAFNDTVRQVLLADCLTFLRESEGYPLFKLLPATYSDMQRVKVRQHKRKDGVTDVFERAFGQTFNNIRNRAVFASSSVPIASTDMEPFYVFPIDGYRYMYSKEVTNSSSDYRNVIDTLVSGLGNLTEATDLVADLLKYTYSYDSLCEGIEAGSEIIFYGIPYYYAIRASAYTSYADVVDNLHR